MNSISEHCISVTHPALQGHFPGNPVVPGVVLLEEIITAIRTWRPSACNQGFQSVKFLHPVAPESRFSIALELLDEARVGFSCRIGQRQVSSGTVILQVTQAPA